MPSCAPIAARSSAAASLGTCSITCSLGSEPTPSSAAKCCSAKAISTPTVRILAWALWDKVELSHLFTEPKLWIDRGGAHLHAERRDGKYRYLDGPDAGQPARLLLFDRVGVEGSSPPPALHRDFRTLAHELGFERARITRRTEGGLLADLRYGDVWVPSVISAAGAKLRLVCESVRPGDARRLATAKRRAHVRERALAVLRREMLVQVRAEVPFDEPHTEWGQQDGHLRGEWLSAYLRGDDFYYFNHDRYPVFDARGAARPPQVCVDFVTETFEHASGTYFRPRGEPRGRQRGRLDFDELIAGNRRQVPAFLRSVRAHPEMFEIDTVPERERLPYLFKRRFYRRLERDRDAYPAGSIVVIRGFAPWDHYNVPHYHTFFVYENDPISGMPILLIGNAGKPRLQSWEPVMARTPQRKIEHVIRPRLDWLESAIPLPANEPLVPPLLAVN